MGTFENYEACLYYDFPNKERIIFQQVIKTTPDKIARRDGLEAYPELRCRIITSGGMRFFRTYFPCFFF